ncbi:hypothetical protein J7E97_14885 [Streptomyces sp. ISL-66]|uniref:hypothetical protein n=1 Tax=Streptomyces sp. ISL-66 TaxID=2819186 RepID=UPI001BED028C|nr:hypothetical protein [Streptomyces sp. ISL-66]MBT2469121.1 hypothetical protein [Streptomyces sp. ISL-66]
MPQHPPPRTGDEREPGRAYSARFHLLDRQILDQDGVPLAKVDDLELSEDDHGHLYVTAILIGPTALAPRLSGRPARLLDAVARRLTTGDTPGHARIDMSRITRIGAALTATTPTDEEAVHPLEDWTRDHVIAPLPGSGHAPG